MKEKNIELVRLVKDLDTRALEIVGASGGQINRTTMHALLAQRSIPNVRLAVQIVASLRAIARNRAANGLYSGDPDAISCESIWGSKNGPVIGTKTLVA